MLNRMTVEILVALMFGCFIIGGIGIVTGNKLRKYIEKLERREEEKKRGNN